MYLAMCASCASIQEATMMSFGAGTAAPEVSDLVVVLLGGL